jgi:hypothetical protein
VFWLVNTSFQAPQTYQHLSSGAGSQRMSASAMRPAGYVDSDQWLSDNQLGSERGLGPRRVRTRADRRGICRSPSAAVEVDVAGTTTTRVPDIVDRDLVQSAAPARPVRMPALMVMLRVPVMAPEQTHQTTMHGGPLIGVRTSLSLQGPAREEQPAAVCSASALDPQMAEGGRLSVERRRRDAGLHAGPDGKPSVGTPRSRINCHSASHRRFGP